MALESIYAYDDYRLYVRDAYAARKEQDPSCSSRSFAREAGFSNPGFLNDVIKGRRKLSKEAVEKCISVFKLESSEADFFRLLVTYNQAKKVAEKEKIYKHIVRRRNHSLFTRLDPAMVKYYQDYRYPLIRTAIMACDFRGDFETLARFIFPSLAPQEVRKYVEDLVAWGLVVINKAGSYKTTAQFVEPPESLQSTIKELNREWIRHALELHHTLPPNKRHMSSRLLAVSPQTAEIISKKIEALKHEVWELVKDDPHDPTTVMQLNMQYFPRSRNNGASS